MCRGTHIDQRIISLYEQHFTVDENKQGAAVVGRATPVVNVLFLSALHPKSGPMKIIKTLLPLISLFTFCAPATVAQVVGLNELDTLFQEVESTDPLASLAFHGGVQRLRRFHSPEDVLSTLYADVGALGTPFM